MRPSVISYSVSAMLDLLFGDPFILEGGGRIKFQRMHGMTGEFKPGLTFNGRVKAGKLHNFYPEEQLDIPSSKH